MKVLFIMLQLPFESKRSGMYAILAEEYIKNGHKVTIIAPDVNHKKSFMGIERGMTVIRVASKETQGLSNMIKKGIALATLESAYKKAYNKYLKDELFDWILMPTPPITLSGFVEFVKRKTGAKFYLILRDIHPQSIWSVGLLRHKWMYNYLDCKARKGYACADCIGCMSQGNIDFISSQYPTLDKSKLVLLYNWMQDAQVVKDESIKEKYGLQGKFVVLFGGNIGKGQRIENLVFLAEHYRQNENIVFLVVGKGVEKDRLIKIAKDEKLENIKFLDFMPQADYLKLTSSVDLGLITINENYAVPTCPSKVVAYMSMGVPAFAMINPNNDYGKMIENAGAGYWTVGSDKKRTVALFDKIYGDAGLRTSMCNAARLFYEKNCTPENAYNTMIKQMQNIELL